MAGGSNNNKIIARIDDGRLVSGSLPSESSLVHRRCSGSTQKFIGNPRLQYFLNNFGENYLDEKGTHQKNQQIFNVFFYF